MKVIIFLFVLFVCFSASGQGNCRDVQTGSFYYYPQKSKERFVVSRDKSVQQEINLGSNDTLFWKISWQNDCTFTQQFLRGTRAKTNEEKEYYSSHNVVSQIKGVTRDYYLFTSGLDSLRSPFAITDTVWLSPRNLSR